MPLTDLDAPAPNPFATLTADAVPGVGKYLSTAFDLAMQSNPLQAINRTMIMNEALSTTGGILGVVERHDDMGFQARTGGHNITQVLASDPNARFHWMNKEAAEQRLKEAGLLGRFKVSEQGANALALELIIKANLDEQELSSVFQRRKAGVILGTAGFGAELVASLADPVGFAANFIPIIGQAKYAALLRGAGTSIAKRAFVRAGVGAAEGAAGAALLEPLTAIAANAEMLDYGIADSLYNVAFGAAFGASVHTTLGGVRDLVGGVPKSFAEMPLESRKHIMNAMLAAADEGKAPVLAKIAAEAEVAKMASSKAVVEVAPAPNPLSRQYTIGDNVSGRMADRLFNEQVVAIDKETIVADAQRYAEFSASSIPERIKGKMGGDTPAPGYVRLYADSSTAATPGSQWSPSFTHAESLAKSETGTVTMAMVDVPIEALPVEWVGSNGNLRGQGWLPDHMLGKAKEIISRDDMHFPSKPAALPTRQELANVAESNLDLVEPEYVPPDIEKLSADEAKLEADAQAALSELEAKGYKLDELLVDGTKQEAENVAVRAKAIEQFTACSIGRI
jgi:hypothetical protein